MARMALISLLLTLQWGVVVCQLHFDPSRSETSATEHSHSVPHEGESEKCQDEISASTRFSIEPVGKRLLTEHLLQQSLAEFPTDTFTSDLVNPQISRGVPPSPKPALPVLRI